MDYHSMKRKELQALCKKHNIPANTTNSTMADKLSELFNTCLKSSVGALEEKDSGVGRRRAKSVAKKVDDVNKVESTNEGGDIPVKVTRSRAQTFEDDEVVPANKKKRERGRLKHDKEENESVKECQVSPMRVTRLKAQALEKDGVFPLNQEKKETRAVKVKEKEKEAVMPVRVTRSKVQALELNPQVKKESGKRVAEDEGNVEPSKEIVDSSTRVTRFTEQRLKDDIGNPVADSQVEKKRARRELKVVDQSTKSTATSSNADQEVPKRKTSRNRRVEVGGDGGGENLKHGGRKRSKGSVAEVPENEKRFERNEANVEETGSDHSLVAKGKMVKECLAVELPNIPSRRLRRKTILLQPIVPTVENMGDCKTVEPGPKEQPGNLSVIAESFEDNDQVSISGEKNSSLVELPNFDVELPSRIDNSDVKRATFSSGEIPETTANAILDESYESKQNEDVHVESAIINEAEVKMGESPVETSALMSAGTGTCRKDTEMTTASMFDGSQVDASDCVAVIYEAGLSADHGVSVQQSSFKIKSKEMEAPHEPSTNEGVPRSPAVVEDRADEIFNAHIETEFKQDLLTCKDILQKPSLDQQKIADNDEQDVEDDRVRTQMELVSQLDSSIGDDVSHGFTVDENDIRKTAVTSQDVEAEQVEVSIGKNVFSSPDKDGCNGAVDRVHDEKKLHLEQDQLSTKLPDNVLEVGKDDSVDASKEFESDSKPSHADNIHETPVLSCDFDDEGINANKGPESESKPLSCKDLFGTPVLGRDDIEDDVFEVAKESTPNSNDNSIPVDSDDIDGLGNTTGSMDTINEITVCGDGILPELDEGVLPKEGKNVSVNSHDFGSASFLSREKCNSNFKKTDDDKDFDVSVSMAGDVSPPQVESFNNLPENFSEENNQRSLSALAHNSESEFQGFNLSNEQRTEKDEMVRENDKLLADKIEQALATTNHDLDGDEPVDNSSICGGDKLDCQLPRTIEVHESPDIEESSPITFGKEQSCAADEDTVSGPLASFNDDDKINQVGGITPFDIRSQNDARSRQMKPIGDGVEIASACIEKSSGQFTSGAAKGERYPTPYLPKKLICETSSSLVKLPNVDVELPSRIVDSHITEAPFSSKEVSVTMSNVILDEASVSKQIYVQSETEEMTRVDSVETSVLKSAGTVTYEKDTEIMLGSRSEALPIGTSNCDAFLYETGLSADPRVSFQQSNFKIKLKEMEAQHEISTSESILGSSGVVEHLTDERFNSQIEMESEEEPLTWKDILQTQLGQHEIVDKDEHVVEDDRICAQELMSEPGDEARVQANRDILQSPNMGCDVADDALEMETTHQPSPNQKELLAQLEPSVDGGGPHGFTVGENDTEKAIVTAQDVEVEQVEVLADKNILNSLAKGGCSVAVHGVHGEKELNFEQELSNTKLPDNVFDSIMEFESDSKASDTDHTHQTPVLSSNLEDEAINANMEPESESKPSSCKHLFGTHVLGLDDIEDDGVDMVKGSMSNSNMKSTLIDSDVIDGTAVMDTKNEITVCEDGLLPELNECVLSKESENVSPDYNDFGSACLLNMDESNSNFKKTSDGKAFDVSIGMAGDVSLPLPQVENFHKLAEDSSEEINQGSFRPTAHNSESEFQGCALVDDAVSYPNTSLVEEDKYNQAGVTAPFDVKSCAEETQDVCSNVSGKYSLGTEECQKPVLAHENDDFGKGMKDDRVSDIFQTSAVASSSGEGSSSHANELVYSVANMENALSNVVDEKAIQDVDTTEANLNTPVKSEDVSGELLNLSEDSCLQALFSTPFTNTTHHPKDGQEDTFNVAKKPEFNSKPSSAVGGYDTQSPSTGGDIVMLQLLDAQEVAMPNGNTNSVPIDLENIGGLGDSTRVMDTKNEITICENGLSDLPEFDGGLLSKESENAPPNSHDFGSACFLNREKSNSNVKKIWDDVSVGMPGNVSPPQIENSSNRAENFSEDNNQYSFSPMPHNSEPEFEEDSCLKALFATPSTTATHHLKSSQEDTIGFAFCDTDKGQDEGSHEPAVHGFHHQWDPESLRVSDFVEQSQAQEICNVAYFNKNADDSGCMLRKTVNSVVKDSQSDVKEKTQLKDNLSEPKSSMEVVWENLDAKVEESHGSFATHSHSIATPKKLVTANDMKENTIGLKGEHTAKSTIRRRALADLQRK